MLSAPTISSRTVSPARLRKSICRSQEPIFGPGYSPILYCQYISHARHRDAGELQESDPSLDLSPNQTAQLELRDLERALAKLPKEQRLVILLVGLEGMDYSAAAVNAPLGTVRSRIACGQESLRKATGLFPARHSRRKEFPPVRRQASPPKSPKVVQ